MLRFDPQTGLYADPADQVRQDVIADWKAAFAGGGRPVLDVDPATPAGQLIDSETAIIADKDSQILRLANQFNPRTAEGIWQDALGSIYFLTRKIAEPTVVTCLCTGLAGTVIPAGALVQTDDGLILAATAAAVISDAGTTTARFAARETGPLPVPPRTVRRIVTVTPGWDTVDNPAAGVTGRNMENRAEFESRRYASVSRNAHGSAAAVYSEIADIPGVLDLAVLENPSGESVVRWGVTIPGHSLYVSVSGGDDAAIAEALYRKKDAGCGTAGNTTVSYRDEALRSYPGGVTYSYRIQRPEPLAFGVRVTLRATPATPATVEDAIRDRILADFNGADDGGGAGSARVRTASVVYASRFYRPAMAAGVQDLVSVKIAAPMGSAWLDEVTVRADQAPVLGPDDIRVETVR